MDNQCITSHGERICGGGLEFASVPGDCSSLFDRHVGGNCVSGRIYGTRSQHVNSFRGDGKRCVVPLECHQISNLVILNAVDGSWGDKRDTALG